MHLHEVWALTRSMPPCMSGSLRFLQWTLPAGGPPYEKRTVAFWASLWRFLVRRKHPEDLR